MGENLWHRLRQRSDSRRKAESAGSKLAGGAAGAETKTEAELWIDVVTFIYFRITVKSQAGFNIFDQSGKRGVDHPEETRIYVLSEKVTVCYILIIIFDDK